MNHLTMLDGLLNETQMSNSNTLT